MPDVPEVPETLGYGPTFAKVETRDGKAWTGVLDRTTMSWRFLLDKDGERGPWPLPPGDWSVGPYVGDPNEEAPVSLPVYTIYLNPLDYERRDGSEADLYVMRKFMIDPEVTPTGEVWTANTLEEIRQFVPWTCVRLPREPDDEPHILETWL